MIADDAAEADLLGAVIRQPTHMEAAYGRVDESWFYTPVHRELWAILADLWANGDGLGQHGRRTVWSHDTIRTRWILAGRDGDEIDQLGPKLADGAPLTISGSIDRLEQLAYRRRLATVGMELRETADLEEPLEQLASRADDLRSRLDTQPPRVIGTWADDLDREPDTTDPWIIPGIMRAQWRAVIVASEGAGKSTLLRQLAICAALGVHPFAGTPVPAQPVLVVDVENPRSHVRREHRELWHKLRPDANIDTPKLRYALEAGGLNLRKPSDRAVLDHEFRTTRPTLAVLGPLYKLYSREGRETDEQAAMAAQQVLDGFRTRYGCALILEHHAPHAEYGSTKRNLRPFGSSAWLRWPELGISMQPDDDNPRSVNLGRWRIDRMGNSWPDRLDRGTHLPWTGWWANGIPDRPEA